MLTSYQRQQLEQYSVYVQPAGPVLFHAGELKEHLGYVQEITQAPHRTAAASYMTRRIGLFLSMQFWNLTLYDETWVGKSSDLKWIAVKEFGNPAISLYVNEEQYESIECSREQRMRNIFLLADELIEQLNPSSALRRLHWENIFGYIIWHYHVFFQQPELKEKAMTDWMMMQQDNVWGGSNFLAAYVQNRSPYELIYQPVRTTCCFAKDISGQMKCGFCPLAT